MRRPAYSHVIGLTIPGLPMANVSVEGCEQGMEVLFAALALLPPTPSPPKQLTLVRSEVFGRERVCGHLAQHLLMSSTASSRLEGLQVSRTGMGAEGIAHIADGLQINTTFKKLFVWGCPEVGDAGVEHLSAMLLKNATLQELDLWDIGMTGHGIRDLYNALSSSSATTLKVLRLVAEGADGAGDHVGDLLASNTSLMDLRCEVDVEDKEGRIGQGLRYNRTLKLLTLNLKLQCGGRATDLKQTLHRRCLQYHSPHLHTPNQLTGNAAAASSSGAWQHAGPQPISERA